MVRGVERFREHFKGFDNAFVVIGGVACEEWFASQDLRFRATRDIDMVLVVEAVTPEFVEALWAFIAAGNYQARQRDDGTRIYYRFENPRQEDFPVQIELFSRQPEDLDLAPGQAVTPIRIDEVVSSLSAILMDDDYYAFILGSRETIDRLPLVRVDALIPLKARAWLDLSRRREAGEEVDENDVKKHRNDVFRLAATLPAEPRAELPNVIARDLCSFLDAFPVHADDWRAIGDALKGSLGAAVPTPGELREAIKTYYRLGAP